MEFATSEADIAIYGGSAGGGKSFALLYEPIGRQLHEVPGFSGVLFRRSYPEITNPGGLWDQAGEIYPWAGGKGVVGLREYCFPAGARISFRHIENEETKHNYQGTAICYLAFDELTHFTESMFWYLLSRNRSTCGVRPYVRCTCNPDPGWVKSFLGPWVDDDFSGPRASSGELRWFVRVDGKIRWVNSDHPDAKSLTFIRASIYDNQFLLDRNPEYLATLKALPPVERARLLDGDWNVRREGLVYSGFEACIVDQSVAQRQLAIPPRVGGIDWGFRNPFAANWGHIDHDGVLWITGGRYGSGVTLPVHSEHLPKDVEWWCDPAEPGSIVELRNAGHSVRPCVHLPTRGASGEKKKPIQSGIDMVSERIRNGGLKVVRCPENMPLIREFGLYHYDETKQTEDPIDEDNHAVGDLRYLIVGLDRGRSVPSVVEAESDEQVAIRARTEAQADFERRHQLDLAAQANAMDDRWWNT
jgi:hypothetical protein